MSIKNDIQNTSNKLYNAQQKLDAAEKRRDTAMVDKFTTDIAVLEKQLASLKQQTARQKVEKGSAIKALPFSRPLTKAEQADMGSLKKKVRGLVVVHPMTALGRDMGISVVTGYAKSEF